ncbi:phenylalanyl-tRNA synthetase subunit alpha [Mycoplasma synoviae GX11-T]|nr:phenylalanine--tRNA ligase subunit alpha [Mycoplasmopsis synoviae]MBD5788893.1 phenylalanyl-tRNA synthetase subunit alpha [Mycoplasmopsis synoviae GX11-T]
MKLDLNEINNLEDLKKLKAKLNAADSEMSLLKEEIKKASYEQKALLGQKISKLKNKYQDFFEKCEEKIQKLKIQEKINNEFFDFSKLVNKPAKLHVITEIENRFRTWFLAHGYYESFSGEITDDFENFEILNIPQSHPARATHDSLYFSKTKLLRTHNTGISINEILKSDKKEISTFAIGKVYRNDEDDATHSHQFTQLDFVCVGKVGFSNLIWTLKSLLSYVLEEDIKIKLRPSYFPFTEPSVEVDVFYKNRWIEILGAGMLHSNILKNKKNWSNESAFAAGIGLERIAMIKYDFNDIRELYSNDLRIIEKF